MTGLVKREAEVLREVTEQYLVSGAPVGSRAVSERRSDGLSAASIRHVLAGLESDGYLEQPHTSAGRTPTAKAIRWWLQQLPLPGPEAISTAGLERALLEATEDSDAWTVASRFLSDVSHHLGLVAVHPWCDSGLRQIRFVRLTDRRVLAILVATDGQVRERVGRVPESYAQQELDSAAQYFTRSFPGWTLAQVRRELLHRVSEERAAYDELLKRALVLYHCGLLEMQDSGQVFVQGAGHLAEGTEPQQLAAMLERIQQKERWLRLLMSSPDDGNAEMVEIGGEPGRSLPVVRVWVGLQREEMPGFSLVAADCPLPRHGHGAVAILGPTCMEYRRALCAVMQVGSLLTRIPWRN